MTLVKPFLSSEPCISNIDCLSKKTKLVCTESPQTGQKTCVKGCVLSRAKRQNARKFAQMENFVERITCAEMVKKIVFPFVSLIFCVLVTCGSNSDCADIPEKSNCKQGKDGESTCQSPSKCSCLDDDYCTMEDTCRKPGIQI